MDGGQKSLRDDEIITKAANTASGGTRMSMADADAADKRMDADGTDAHDANGKDAHDADGTDKRSDADGKDAHDADGTDKRSDADGTDARDHAAG